MGKTIAKEYTAFAADGWKSWNDNEPFVSIVTSNSNTWNSIDLTLEEAEKAIVILQEAIEEAKNLPDHKFLDETPF